MKSLVILLFSLVSFAAPVISNITINNQTPNGMRIGWTTDVPSNTIIKIGLVDPPTNIITPLNNNNYTTHVWFASGLTPSTTYKIQVCSSDGVQTCSATQTASTIATDGLFVTPPVAPTPVDTTMPTVNGSSLSVAGDCSNLQSQLNALAALDGNLTHELLIPEGTNCVGQYTLPAKSGPNPAGTGWLLLRNAGTTVQLVPPNTQITQAVTSNYPVIVANYLYAYVNASAPGGCVAGDIWLNTAAVSNWINYCTSATVWTPQTITTGIGAPSGPCAANDWYRDTSIGVLKNSFSWCTVTNVWRKVSIDQSNNNVAWAGLATAANASRWRVIGIAIQDIERPTAYTDLLSRTSGNGDEVGSASFCLAYTQTTNSYIFFDRVLWNGQGYPHRQQEAWCFADGSYLASINSLFLNINRWRPTSAPETSCHGIFFLNGTGPIKIDNNTAINTMGMFTFGSDDTPLEQMDDITYTKNTTLIQTIMNLSEPINQGVLYYFRHHLELKRGNRVLIKGNSFTGGFPSGNPNAASIGLTPRNSPIPTDLQCRTNNTTVSNVNIESNTFQYVPMVLLGTAHNDGPACNTLTGTNISFSNNVAYYTGQSTTGNQNGTGLYKFNGQMNEIGLGWENFNYTNNLHLNPTTGCCDAHMFNFGGDWSAYPNSRFRIENNLYFGANIGYNWGVAISSTGTNGTAALNQMVVPNSTYSYAGNGRQRGQTGGLDNNPAYPAGNYSSQLPGDFSTFVQCKVCGEIGPWRIVAGKFLPGGSAAGTGNTTVGPDLDKLDADMGITINPRVIKTTASTIQFGYFAPDTNACWAGVSTDAVAFTGEIRGQYVGSSDRAQSITLTGLASGTTYNWRIYCYQISTGTTRTK